mgnify:CR=1 FL=1
MRKLFFALSISVLFVFIGCESTDFGDFTNFRPYMSQAINTSYDFQLISDQETVCKVYKLTEKGSGRIFYSLSEPMEWDDDDDEEEAEINASDLPRFTLITEQNAKDVINFITQIENTYSKDERKDDGVLYDLRLVHSYTYYGWTTDAITSVNTSTTENRNTNTTDSKGYRVSSNSTTGSSFTSETATTESYKELEANDIVLRIQLKTEENEDEIHLLVSGKSQEVDIEDLQGLKAVLSK